MKWINSVLALLHAVIDFFYHSVVLCFVLVQGVYYCSALGRLGTLLIWLRLYFVFSVIGFVFFYFLRIEWLFFGLEYVLFSVILIIQIGCAIFYDYTGNIFGIC